MPQGGTEKEIRGPWTIDSVPSHSDMLLRHQEGGRQFEIIDVGRATAKTFYLPDDRRVKRIDMTSAKTWWEMGYLIIEAVLVSTLLAHF